MKRSSKKGLLTQSSSRFCVFPRFRSKSPASECEPVYLNVYDLTPMNGYVYWAGLGIFHSGVEVHGVEYAFGAHDFSTSGVFEVDPRQCPGFKFRRSILIGTTRMDPNQIRDFMESLSANYTGDAYHLIVKNCNHFSADVCYKLTGRRIPTWVNRLARIGSVCNCLLPEPLRVSAIHQEPEFEAMDGEKKRLRSAFTCLSSISIRQKQLSSSSSSSSLFFPTPVRSCFPSWDLRRSTNDLSLNGR